MDWIFWDVPKSTISSDTADAANANAAAARSEKKKSFARDVGYVNAADVQPVEQADQEDNRHIELS